MVRLKREDCVAVTIAKRRAKAVLRKYALTFDGAQEAHPWGENVTKVRGKVFVFVKQPARGAIDIGLMKEWIAESYEAVAPKRPSRPHERGKVPAKRRR